MKALQVSIRTRIIALVAGALATCLAAFLYFGQGLLIADKSSYIFDAAYSKVSTASELIRASQHRFETLSEMVKRSGFSALSTSNSQPYFARISFKDSPTPQVREIKGALTPEQVLKQSPWSTQELKRVAAPLLYIPSDGKYIDFASRISTSNILMGRIVPPRGLLEGQTREMELKILTETEASSMFPADIWKSIQSSEFVSGVKEITYQNSPYLLGYERLPGTSYWIMSLSSKAQAFASTKELQRKTLLLGGGLVLVTLGLALLLIRSLVLRIRALVDTTRHIARGDFTHELKTGLTAHDELGVLSRAFNTMSQKIQELLVATADKARMEKELETAQEVQGRFFPSAPFYEHGLHIDGNSLPASKCGGDFWNYAKVGKQVVILMGDVTGHGLSAAFMTATIHTAFSYFTDQLQKSNRAIDSESDILSPLLKFLNRSVFLSSAGNATFPCLCMTLDLETGSIHFVNSGHPVPFRLKSDGTFEVISSEPHLPLGQDGEYPVRAVRLQMEPSERILWYTDGLFDERRSDSSRLKKKDLLQNLAEIVATKATPGETLRLSSLVLDRAREFFTDNPDNRHDDITVISIELEDQAQAKWASKRSAA